MKSYNQYCGTAAALDLLGERWTLLILRDLLTGPRRYSDMLADLHGITTNLLAKRLRDMQSADLITRIGTRYALTDKGQATQPIIMALADFGTSLLTFPPSHDQHTNPRWLVLNLHRRYRGGWDDQINITFPDKAFAISSDGTSLSIIESPPTFATSLIASGPGLARWILMGASLDRLIALKSVGLVGPREPALELDACLSAVT